MADGQNACGLAEEPRTKKEEPNNLMTAFPPSYFQTFPPSLRLRRINQEPRTTSEEPSFRYSQSAIRYCSKAAPSPASPVPVRFKRNLDDLGKFFEPFFRGGVF